ncbi:MAG: TetR/AcrR family transcriptional regulator [Corynebacterium sp.]|nr:TetR/AcrR family transcriptional regulator [Corynebacterium sp.]
MSRNTSSENAERRQEILAGARRAFAEYGYEGATVRRIEQMTGKSRGAIFHYFEDKESLFFALAKEDAELMADIVARDGLVAVLRDVLDHPDKANYLSTRLEIARLLRVNPEFHARWDEHQRVLDDAVTARLLSRSQTGEIRDDVPTPVLLAYLETLQEGFISMVLRGADTDVLSQMLDLVEESIRFRSAHE